MTLILRGFGGIFEDLFWSHGEFLLFYSKSESIWPVEGTALQHRRNRNSISAFQIPFVISASLLINVIYLHLNCPMLNWQVATLRKTPTILNINLMRNLTNPQRLSLVWWLDFLFWKTDYCNSPLKAVKI